MNDEMAKFKPIIDLITQKLGLKSDWISPNKWREIFEQRMAAVNFTQVAEYRRLLEYSLQERQAVIEQIVIPETWFFRDRGAIDLMLLLIKQKHFKTLPLKILSIACSTGEEPYSIAMAFEEVSFSNYSLEGLDISQSALIKAQTGIYQKNAFRGDLIKDRTLFFDQTAAGFALHPGLKEKITFHEGNILEETVSFSEHSYSFILCRNLLIYLNISAQNKILKRIEHLLLPEGIFFVGPAETHLAFNAGFTPLPFPNTYGFSLPPKHPMGSKDALLDFSLTEYPAQMLQAAHQLADQGAFEAAKELSFNYIERYGVNSEIYYLLGIIHQALEKEKEAEDFFRKTIYLSPHHYEALVCLALLHESKGDQPQADLFRQRAQKSGQK